MRLLTPRERDVMERVVSGKSNKVIAAELRLSMKTVEVHRAHVMEKLEGWLAGRSDPLALLATEEDDGSPAQQLRMPPGAACDKGKPAVA